MIDRESIAPGAEFRVTAPFVKVPYTVWDEGGSFEAQGWKPGTRFEQIDDEMVYGPSRVADAEGFAVYRVVEAVMLPRPYGERIFFTRTWVNPDGEPFGKRRLMVTPTHTFRRWASGWRHQYEMG